MESLPNELKLYIKEYLFTNCTRCNNYFCINDLKNDLTTIHYIPIFDDNFVFPNIYNNYKYLCIKCIKELKKKLIIPVKY